jgi:hypothetical protein
MGESLIQLALYIICAHVMTEFKRTPDLPGPLREFFGIVLSVGGKAHTTCRVDMRRLQEMVFPHPI